MTTFVSLTQTLTDSLRLDAPPVAVCFAVPQAYNTGRTALKPANTRV